MSDLRLTGDHFVGELSTIDHPPRQNQPSIPPGSGVRTLAVNPCNYMDYGGGDQQTADRGCVRLCLVAGQSPWARAWTAAYWLPVRSVFDTEAPLQQRYAALYECYMCLLASCRVVQQDA